MNCCSKSPPICDSSGLPGSTIEEKTRCLLGWSVNSGAHREDYSKMKNNFVKNRRSDSFPYDLNALGAKDFNYRKSVTGKTEGINNCLIQIKDLLESSDTKIAKDNGAGSVVSSSNSTNILDLKNSTINDTSDIFEQLKRQVPRLYRNFSDNNKFKLLFQTAANVVELEAKLAHLKQETARLSNKLRNKDNDIQIDTVDTYNSDKNVGVSSEDSNARFCRSFADTTNDMPEDLQCIDVTAFKSMVAQNHSRESYSS